MAIIGFILTGASGVILSSRFGLTGDQAFPKWITIKYSIWIAIGITSILLSFKFKNKITKLYWPVTLLTIISIIVSIYKPL